LEERHGSDQAELSALYEQRRVGNTEPLTQFCRDKRHIFFVADLDIEPVLCTALSTAVNAELLGFEAANAVYPRWEDTSRLLAQYGKAERLVVVLDEFTTWSMLILPSYPSCNVSGTAA
jgi:hypothetical protein